MAKTTTVEKRAEQVLEATQQVLAATQEDLEEGVALLLDLREQLGEIEKRITRLEAVA